MAAEGPIFPERGKRPCKWCGEIITPTQPCLIRSVFKLEGGGWEIYHHDCYVYGLIPGEQDQRKRRHREEMAAAQEGGPRA